VTGWQVLARVSNAAQVVEKQTTQGRACEALGLRVAVVKVWSAANVIRLV
jgi:hypothetical protein